MDSAETPLPSRRTLLRGAALTALTTAAFPGAAPSQPAQAAVPDKPEPHKPRHEPHPSYRAIVGLI